MGGMIGNNNNKKKRISMSFKPNHRVVGLGIVAALVGEGRDDNNTNSIIISSSSTYKKDQSFVFPNIKPALSNPIPILNPQPLVLPNLNHHLNNNINEMELSEEYTCVISHIGDNLIKKTEYFDSGVLALQTHTSNSTSTYSGNGDEVAAVKTASFQAADFLKSCYLCDKHLHGLDIFMYRGEKAFCSAECRYEQMVKDERKEKEKEKLKKKNRGSLGKGATTMKTMMMNKPSFEFSSSTPCSSPIQLIAGIVAA